MLTFTSLDETTGTDRSLGEYARMAGGHARVRRRRRDGTLCVDSAVVIPGARSPMDLFRPVFRPPVLKRRARPAWAYFRFTLALRTLHVRATYGLFPVYFRNAGRHEKGYARPRLR